MGVEILSHLEALSEAQITSLQENPSEIESLVFSNEDDWKATGRVALGLESGWQSIHFLLTGDAWAGEPPLGFLADPSGGIAVQFSDESPPCGLYSPAAVAIIAEDLEAVTAENLLSRFDPDKFDEEGIMPFGLWHKPAEECIDGYLLPNFEALKAFMRKTNGDGKGLLSALGVC